MCDEGVLVWEAGQERTCGSDGSARSAQVVGRGVAGDIVIINHDHGA